jgi:hypothetical protein
MPLFLIMMIPPSCPKDFAKHFLSIDYISVSSPIKKIVFGLKFDCFLRHLNNIFL